MGKPKNTTLLVRIAPQFLVAIIILMWGSITPSSGSPLFYYDIATATSSLLPLVPHYLGGSEDFTYVSALQSSGLAPAWACCQSGSGQLSFSGWGRGAGDPGYSGPAHLEFSISATSNPVQLFDIAYSWFSTLNSDTFGGPDHVSVYGSPDEFQTAFLIGTHSIPNAPPGSWRGPLSLDDDLAGYVVAPGETLTVRMVGWGSALSWDAGAGLWNTFGGNVNLTVNGAQFIPEPDTWQLLAVGIAATFAARRSLLMVL